MIRPRGAIVLEQVPLQPLERGRAQKASGHDPVRVDVVAAERHAAAGHDQNGSAGHYAGTPSSTDRTSTTSPAMPAAATIAGLIKSVRPVGLPCRPLKFRFDEDAHT